MSSSTPTVPATMKAIEVQPGAKKPDGPTPMVYTDVPTPKLGEKEVLIKIHATAVNRADTLQREGRYAPPPGATNIMGLECVGEIVASGAGSTKFPIGTRVMALLAGGGYAGYVNVDEGSVMPLPKGFDYEKSAAIPEVFLTAYLISRQLGGLKKGDVVLIHAGASGVGTALIQICKMYEAIAIVSVSTEKKAEFCKNLGAAHAVNYKTEPKFSGNIKTFCRSLNPPREGVSLVLDPVGGSHVHQNLESMETDARWILYGLLGGTEVDKFPLRTLLMKRIKLEATTLRSRSLEYKANLVANFAKECLPAFEDGRLRPIIDATFPLSEMTKAHELMESNQTIGKIVIKVTEH